VNVHDELVSIVQPLIDAFGTGDDGGGVSSSYRRPRIVGFPERIRISEKYTN
jgi:hypothetical protein